MSMLAERRKKTKYRLQPFSGFSKTNKRTDNDTSSFGYKMMSSMGWAPGKGLGLNESGHIDPIKLRLKNDATGLGFKVSEDDALAQQSEFQHLLLQLNSGPTDGEINCDEPKVKAQKPKIKSLEKLSEQSTVRVHYKKFTRGKDLSRASERDLRSILGISSKKPKAKEPEPELEVTEPVNDTPVGEIKDTYITAGSSVDYFKKRLQKKSKKENDAVMEVSSLATGEESCSIEKNKRRSVTWGEIDISYVDKYIKDMVNTSESVDESINDGECFKEPPFKKMKKKRKDQQSPVDISEDTAEENAQLNTEKKKKKKRKLCEEDCSKENVAQEEQHHSISKKKKKRKLNVENQDDYVFDANNCVDNKDTDALVAGEEFNSNADLIEEPKQNKKKKKRRNQVAALPEQTE